MAVSVLARGKTAWFNRAALDLLGARTPDDVLRRDALDFVEPAEHPELRRRLRRTESRDAPSLEIRLRRVDGRSARASLRSFRLPRGRGRVVFAHHLPERRFVEQQFRSLVDSAPYGILVTTPDRKLRFANPAMRALVTNDRFNEDPNRSVLEVVHPDDHERMARRHEALHRDEDPGPAVIRLLRDDGTWVHCEVQSAVIHVGGERLFRSFVRDVSESRRSQDALRESEAQYRSLLEGSPNAITVTQGGRFVLVNPAYLRLMGAASLDHLTTQPPSERVHPDFRAAVEERMASVHAGQPTPLLEQKAVRMDGAVIDVEAQSAPIVFEGRPAVLSTLRDITRRKARERALRDSELRYRQLIELLPDPVFVIDEGLIVYANPGTRQLIDLAPDLAQNPLDLVGLAPEQDRDRLRELIEKVTATRKTTSGEVRLTRDRGTVQVEIRAAAIEMAGRPAALVVARDLTQRRRAEQIQSALYRIAQASTRASSIEDLLPEVSDIVGELMYARNLFIGLLDDADEYLTFPYYRDESPTEAPARLRASETLSGYVIRTGQPLLADGPAVDALRHSEGLTTYGGLPASWIGIPLIRGARTFGVLVVQSYDPKIIYTPADRDLLTFVSGHIAEAIERKRKDEEIHGLAYRDSLTGLPNRTLFEDRLRQALALAERSRSSLAVLFVDLDRFKDVNDSLGHSVGDGVLRLIADRLVGCLRESDTIARRGGDEFLALLPDTDAEGAALVAAKLIAALRTPVVAAGNEVVLTTSIGVALFPENGKDVGELLKAADIAMYRAKDNGRDTHQMFTAELNDEVEQRIGMERGLRTAIVRRKLILHFQPIVDGDGNPVAAEALVRWPDDSGRLTPPSSFITVAENSGLIVPLGDWVLRDGMRRARSWPDAAGRPVRLAVNVSTRQLVHPAFEDELFAAVAAESFPEKLLTLEITESAALAENAAMVDRLHRIRERGISVAIDDFGVGYSSFSRLKSLPVDTLKIDASFVRSLLVDERNAAVADAIVMLARALDLRTVAEGVESPEQRARLLQAGCAYMQGYLFSPPVDGDAFEEFLTRTRT